MKLNPIKIVFLAIILFVAFTILSSISFAVPANSTEQVLVQPSGEKFKAVQHGDEWFNWVTTETGEVIVQDKDKFWKYAEYSSSGVKAGKYKYKVHKKPSKLVKQKDFVQWVKQNNIKSKSKPVSSQSVDTSAQSAPTAPQKVLVLLVQFSDTSVKYTDAAWNNTFFGTSGSTVNNYYKEVSGGEFYFLPAEENVGASNDGIAKVTLGYPHPNTGRNTGYANQKIVSDALTAANQYINYASFDTDGNGYISTSELHIVTIIAGYEAAYGGGMYPSVWGHRWSTSVNLDGKYLSAYTQQGEIHYNHMATIGILCHELGHDLGLPDLYDYDGSSEGVGIHSLMAGGSWAYQTYAGDSPTHLDAWCKTKLGFATPQIVDSLGSYTVNAAASGQYNVLKVPTAKTGEYFLVENRQFSGFDKGLSNICRVSGGIAIWHIDESVLYGWAPNNNESHKGVDLEESNQGILGYSQLDTRKSGFYVGSSYYVGYSHYYYSGNTSTVFKNTNTFGPSTIPNNNLYDGTNTGITISVPGTSSNSMTVTVTMPIIPKGSIETPSNGAVVGDIVTVKGWALDTEGVSKVEILVDGKLNGTAVYGQSRPDIGSQYPEYNNSSCGFSYSIDTLKLINASHTITLRETSKTGKQNTLYSVTIKVSNTGTTNISYRLSENASTSIKIYDSTNTLVKTLVNNILNPAGMNSAAWDGSSSSGGIVDDGTYTYIISASDLVGLQSEPAAGTIVVNRSPSVSKISDSPNPFRPTGANVCTISYTLYKNATVSLKIYNSSGSLVKTLVNGAVTAGTHSAAWDGKNEAGTIVETGTYTYKFESVDSQGRTASPIPGTIDVDLSPPLISEASASPDIFAPTGSNVVTILYTLSENAKTTVSILDSSNNLVKTLETGKLKSWGANSITWDGKNSSGSVVKDGTYIYKISAVDLVGLSASPVTGSIVVKQSYPAITSVTDGPDPIAPNGQKSCIIKYVLSKDADVVIKVFDQNNNLVKTLVNGPVAAGSRSAEWYGNDEGGSLLGSGIYTYTINATDSFGRKADQVIGTITIDLIPPEISGVTVDPDPFEPIE